LAGLEKAVYEGGKEEVSLAIRRILLIHNVIMSIGGIPLIYLGDEVGTLNDYTYREDPAKVDDSRWVHRPAADEKRYAQRNEEDTIPGQIYQNLKRLIDLRKTTEAIGGNAPEFINSGNPHVFGYIRRKGNLQVLVLNNFSDHTQVIPGNILRLSGLGYQFKDLITGKTIEVKEDLLLEPFQFMWLNLVK
jgi:amylosucrase